jgi:DNA-binding transcriptional regulator YhcF (GntR family)
MTHDRVEGDTFELTQEFLAMMVGVGRQAVNEAAQDLQDAGVIAYSRGRISILDRSGLEAASCDCYEVIRSEFDRLLPRA